MNSDQLVDHTDTTILSSEVGSPTNDLVDYERTTVQRILRIEQFRLQEIAKNERWPRKNANVLKKLKPASKGLQKLLEEEVDTDCVLIASDGQEIKCHKTILTAKIPRFGIFFGHENMESRSGRVELEPRMNSEVTTAFLRYLYLHDMDAIVKNFDVASSLIYAGHYYDVPDLINDVALVFRYYEEELQVWDFEWGSIDKYWDLYDLVRLWEDGHPSKRTVVDSIFGMIKKVWMKSCGCGTGTHTLEKLMEKDTAALIRFIGYLTKTWEVSQPKMLIKDDCQEYGSRGNRSSVRGRASGRRTWTYLKLNEM